MEVSVQITTMVLKYDKQKYLISGSCLCFYLRMKVNSHSFVENVYSILTN